MNQIFYSYLTVILNMTNATSNLQEAREKLSEYVSKGDAEGAASLYTENACFMPHQSPLSQGRSEIIEAYNNDFKKGVTGLMLSPYEVIEGDDIVAERGDTMVTIEIGEGKKIERVVKYVVLWKKTSEGYRIHWDIFNPNSL
jgi:ketosteroid isomerase-like protein